MACNEKANIFELTRAMPRQAALTCTNYSNVIKTKG
jgi:hypothetical protein